MKDNSTSIFIRLTSTEKENIQKSADEMGVTVNTYIRYLGSINGVNKKYLIKTNDLTEFTSEIALLRRTVEGILKIAQLEKTVSSQNIASLKELLDSIDTRCAEIQEQTYKIRISIRNKKSKQ